MNRLKWEMKSPKGKSRSTVKHAFQAAAKQSENVIFDLRRIIIPESKAIGILDRLMSNSKRVKRLAVITKKQKLVWFPFDFQK